MIPFILFLLVIFLSWLTFTAHETSSDFINAKDKHDNKPIPDTFVPGIGLPQTSYSNFYALMVGSNRAAKKPSTVIAFIVSKPSLHKNLDLRFGSSRQKP
ncbi:hypothetical protein CLOM621_05622 [Clostridium sp. M62/1]|nr:hypothetical protein CLOM621_05622 [Clostridium sp. M62/1]